MAKIITDQNFEELVASGLPFVVDFSATWCGPCKKISPIIDELATEYEGRVIIGKCDVDEADDLTSRFGIRSVPTVLFFKNGELVNRHIGACRKGDLQKLLDGLL